MVHRPQVITDTASVIMFVTSGVGQKKDSKLVFIIIDTIVSIILILTMWYIFVGHCRILMMCAPKTVAQIHHEPLQILHV
jgi:hypothetical protein